MSLIAAVYALRRLRSKPTGYEQVSRRERRCRSAPSKRVLNASCGGGPYLTR